MDAYSIDGQSTRRLYPEGELIQAPLAIPLSGPKLVTSDDDLERESKVISPSIYENTLSGERRRKHESYTLSGSVFLITAKGQTLKLPAPSDSPADPLGWGRWKKAGAFLAVFWYSTVALTVAQAASVFLRAISTDFGLDSIEPWQIQALVTAPTLFIAVGAVLWIPLTIGMGRRPVLLLASFVLFIATLGAGYVQTFEQLLVCVCFFGIAEGFALTAAFLVVIDMTFIDERPKGIALMWSVAGFFGTAFVALVPYIADHGKEWRSYYRYWSIPAMVSMALVFFLFPETYFKRPTVAFDGLIVLQSATEKTTVFKDIEVDSDIYRDLPQLPQQQGVFGRYSIWRSPFSSWISMGRCFLQIAFCAINPLIFSMTIAISVNYAGMLFIGANYARILGDEPYNLPSRLLTLVNLSSAIGGLVAYPIGIIPVQKIMDRLTKRNRGVREAEHYLIGLILPELAGAMSSLLFGMAVHYKCRLGAYYMAYGLNGFSWVTMAIITTIWVTEAFPRWAAPALAAMSGGAFLISFGMCFATAPWIEAHGFKLVGIELAVLQIVTGLVAVPIAFWGKSARQAIHGRWADERGGALRPL